MLTARAAPYFINFCHSSSSSSLLFVLLPGQPIVAPGPVNRVIGLRVGSEALATGVSPGIVHVDIVVLTLAAVQARMRSAHIVRLTARNIIETSRLHHRLIVELDLLIIWMQLLLLLLVVVIQLLVVCHIDDRRHGQLLRGCSTDLLVVQVVPLHLVKLICDLQDVAAAGRVMRATMH